MFRGRPRQAAAWAALILLCATACSGAGAGGETSAAGPATSPPPAVSGNVNVAGTDLAYTCQGFGSPTVILEAGLATGGIEAFRTLLPKIATMTRVCTYDRAGVGTSQARPLSDAPVPGAELAREAHLLFSGLGIHPPYILVGESFGGLLVRTQAAAYPGDAAGMVLVDPVSEPDVAYYRRSGVDPWIDRTSKIDVPSIVTLLNNFPSLASIPLVVVTTGSRQDPPLGQSPEREAAFQDHLASLSSNSMHVTSTDPGHPANHPDPRLVVAAIRAALDAAQRGGDLRSCQLVFPAIGGTCS